MRRSRRRHRKSLVGVLSRRPGAAVHRLGTTRGTGERANEIAKDSGDDNRVGVRGGGHACGGSSGNSAACTAFYKAIGNTGVSQNAYINNVQAAADQASGQTATDMTTVVDDIVTNGIPVPSRHGCSWQGLQRHLSADAVGSDWRTARASAVWPGSAVENQPSRLLSRHVGTTAIG
jgi:hypothetical protein